MISQPDAILASLSWSQINSREYQLRGDGRVLGVLRIDDSFDSSMTGEIGARRWTFKRTGLIRISVRVYAECDGADCATLVQSGAGEYIVSFPDGQSLRWKQTNNQRRQEWGFFDCDGTALIVFVPMVADSGYQARVKVSTAGHALSNLDLLLLLGWYVLVSKYRDDEFRSAMITAMAWGVS
jgi:hypothetical protein